MKELLKGMAEDWRIHDKAILIKAQPIENWRNISFTLYKNDTETVDERYFYPVFWQFVIYNNVEENNQKMEVSYLKYVGGKQKPAVEEKIDKNNFFSDKKEFELMLNLRISNIDIFINGNAFNWTFLLDDNKNNSKRFINRKEPKIDFLKIEADAILKENKTIYGTQSMILLGGEKTSVINENNRAILQLEVIKNAKWFQIRFLTARDYLNLNEYVEHYCFDAEQIKDYRCIIELFIEVDFENGTTVLGDYNFKEGEEQQGKEVVKRNEIPSKAKFERNKNYQIKMEREKKKGKFIITYGNGFDNGLVESYECEVTPSPFFIQIKGDIRLLDFSFEKRSGN